MKKLKFYNIADVLRPYNFNYVFTDDMSIFFESKIGNYDIYVELFLLTNDFQKDTCVIIYKNEEMVAHDIMDRSEFFSYFKIFLNNIHYEN